ncbi:glycosyltransferase [Puniceibacterium sp. IMCC21224]|uniref:glycosyltransferase n=1 Tax=Puniceibacterium sp. IMCC21224 TaxID=1618204 RepID=UPI00064DA2FB|nr:glycosyltransferase [Puniceibacterium sp. IMCC21224]KMK66126.1 glycosyl transferase [Puniceibacterium sp. IMCC21224]
MRAPITVIIPTLDAERVLPATMSALMEGLEAGLIRELVLSDGGSMDTTPDLADAAGAVWITGPRSRGGQLRRGAEVARGDWLLFLRAGMVLHPGWAKEMRAAISEPGAYYFYLRLGGRGAWPKLRAGWANLRARVFGLAYGNQGLLIDIATYGTTGGFADAPRFEDVAMARALSGRLRSLPVTAETQARGSAAVVRHDASALRLVWRRFQVMLSSDPRARAETLPH